MVKQAKNLTSELLTMISQMKSTKAQDIKKLREALDKLPDIREEKVEDLKSQIKKGTYCVTGEKIAEKIIAESLMDIITEF